MTRYPRLRRWLPRPLARRFLFVEAAIEDAVKRFAGSLAQDAAVLDAGAGEAIYKPWFASQRYFAVDLGVGDASWDYSSLDAIADLATLPFRDGSFDACVNIVTLEHVKDPARVLREIARVLKPGGRLLLIVPQDWEVHQSPNDYFRYTRHGVRYLLEQAGLKEDDLTPMGGFFRLLQRRLLNALQFFPGISFPLALLLLAPVALMVPCLDSLDRQRDFTLGYICIARRP